MPAKVILKITKGPMRGQQFVFEEHDTFVFGRSRRACHARIPKDAFVSRHHFILEVNPPHLRLRDLGSSNGTYVNGVKHGGRDEKADSDAGPMHRSPQVELKHGDVIQVGKTVFRVEIHTDRDVAEVTRQPQLPAANLASTCQRQPTTNEAGLPDRPYVCHQCGRDVSQEIPEGSTGEYLCLSCQGRHSTNPVKLLHEMIRKAAAGRPCEPLPSITGYSVHEPIGRGGMGVVYAGTRERDGKKVAIKLMLSKVAVDPTGRANFLREIDVLRDLKHPNVVGYLDSGATGTVFYFVMDYCRGGSLSRLLKRRHRPSLAAAGRIMLQVLAGITYAHDRGFVHRDLKPGNILIDERNGRAIARVSDFGLAKSFQRAGFSGMTATGAFAGTYRFMPREQLTNFKYVQPASDIWSAGAILYYMLCGEPPRDFAPGRDPIEVVLEDRIVPIRQRRADVPEAIALVIDRAVASDVNERFSSARDMHAALAAALKSSS